MPIVAKMREKEFQMKVIQNQMNMLDVQIVELGLRKQHLSNQMARLQLDWANMNKKKAGGKS